jgi:uncharacterized protein RhaS with RHS repeats
LNGSFWKNAALLTAIVASCLGVFFTVIMPLYSSDSPLKGVAQTEAADANERLLRFAYDNCEAANTVRANQRLVLSVLAERKDIFRVRRGKHHRLDENTLRVVEALKRIDGDTDCVALFRP